MNAAIKPEKPLKAYNVGEDSDGGQVIVFARHAATARREGGNELNLMFDEVNFCRRAPWADQFIGAPFIPAKAYHDQGWYISCCGCGKYVYEDDEDDEGNRVSCVYDGAVGYCSAACKQQLDEEKELLNASGDLFKAKVLALRPDLDFTKWRIHYPQITKVAEFKFSGCQYGGSVRLDEGGEIEWYIANGDKAAWDYYNLSRIIDPVMDAVEGKERVLLVPADGAQGAMP